MQEPAQSVLVRWKDSYFHVNTDDRDLAALLSSTSDAPAPSHQQNQSNEQSNLTGLRQRGKLQADTAPPEQTQALTPEQLAALLHESPFIDTDSAMTAYEWIKFTAMLPWLLFRIVVAIPLLIVAWSSTALLVAGVQVNAPLPRWRRRIVSGYLR